MNKLAIDIQRIPQEDPDGPQSIVIRSGQTVLTRLLRPGESDLDDCLRAPPSQLAFWLVDNWWRLRFECVPPGIPSPEWRVAHDMASIGGGYVWPRLTFWGEGERVGLIARSDPAGVVAPVRYVTDALLFMAGAEFENAVDGFLRLASDERMGFGSDREALVAQLKALHEERQDSEVAAWRRLEAQLGFDPDEGPISLLEAIAMRAARYGSRSIEEAVQAHPGYDAVAVLDEEISIAESAGWPCDFSAAAEELGRPRRDPMQPPWRYAEDLAYQMRHALGVSSGPVADSSLAELANISPDALRAVPRTGQDLPYGLRLMISKESHDRLAFRNRAATSRRFELSRAVGDAIWGNADLLGPLARSKTARQKFQRAFAQTLLCPFDELIQFVEKSEPSEDDIISAASYFNVSELVVRTTFVNKNVIARQLDDLVEAA